MTAKGIIYTSRLLHFISAIITLASVLNLRSNSAKAINVRALDAYPASSRRKTAWF